MRFGRRAFTVPPEQIRADPERIASIESIFRSGVSGNLTRHFLAAPHGGSPSRKLVGKTFARPGWRGVPELEELRDFALDHLSNSARTAEVVSEGKLQQHLDASDFAAGPPCRQSLMPAAGIPYHTIVGILPDRLRRPTD